ncbi:MAG: cytochrome c biogenesis protein ResB [Alphaproteobacteria bacterium]
MKDFLSSPRLLHYTLPFVMIYLVAGTIAQKYIGLYAATHMFFSAPVVHIIGIPLPGFPILLSIIFLNLACKLLFKSPWTKYSAGIIITHIGVMLLLIGGLVTALFSQEGFIDLALHQSKDHVQDYHNRVFVIKNDDDDIIYTIDHQELNPGNTIKPAGLPISITIKEACRNCQISKRTNADETFHGMAQHMTLNSTALRLTDEENMGGLTFTVNGSDNDGTYVTLEDVPRYPEISSNDTLYKFSLQKEHRTLPFSVELLDFERQVHPGTQMARAYQSHVRIIDGDTQWESIISMNEPLRYKGYSFYQSSFIATEGGNISVLAVVWNAGRTFPYIAGIVMSLGLIVHLFIARRRV